MYKDKTGIFPLSHLGVLQVKGKDALVFLQGQLTCDMREVSARQVKLGACCDHKGRMLATFRIWQEEEHIYALLLSKALLEPLQQHFKKYALFSKVDIATFPQHFIQAYCGDISYGIPDAVSAHRKLIIKPMQLPSNLPILDQNAWVLLEMEDDIVTLYPETSGLFLPQMIGLEKLGGVSFKKGCYVGQEIIARTQHLGKLKRHLCRAQIETGEALTPGSSLLNKNKESIGIVVESVLLKPHSYQILAVVYDQHDIHSI